MKRIICDICGREIDLDTTYAIEMAIKDDDIEMVYDLCEPCRDDVLTQCDILRNVNSNLANVVRRTQNKRLL